MTVTRAEENQGLHTFLNSPRNARAVAVRGGCARAPGARGTRLFWVFRLRRSLTEGSGKGAYPTDPPERPTRS